MLLGATTVVLAIAGAITTLAANRVVSAGRILTINVVTGLQTCVTIATPCTAGNLSICKTTSAGPIGKTVFTGAVGTTQKCTVPFRKNVL